MSETKATRVEYGEYLVELGKEDEKIVVLDADLAAATNTAKFRDAYPDRFFDCGIAECNMMGMAAGMAAYGLKPFASTFAVFGSGRAYEVIRNSIGYPHLNVNLAFSHAGVTVGEDGGSHQSIEDIALMRVIPGMTVLVPSDANQVRDVMDAAMKINGPVYIRLSRFATEVLPKSEFTFGKISVLKDGTDATLVCCGLMVEVCLKAAEILEKSGISVAVLNSHTVKPFDKETMVKYAKKTGKVISVEEHSVIGGLGDAVADALCGCGEFVFKKIGVPDVFGESASAKEMLDLFGLTPEKIADKVRCL